MRAITNVLQDFSLELKADYEAALLDAVRALYVTRYKRKWNEEKTKVSAERFGISNEVNPDWGSNLGG